MFYKLVPTHTMFQNSVLVVLSLGTLAAACCSLNSGNFRRQKPIGGISPCLIPPFENIVYRFEAPVIGRPEVRTGCWSQQDEEGTPFPRLSFHAITTVKTHRFFVIDATGKEVPLRTDGSVQIELVEKSSVDNQTTHTAVRRSFQFRHLCFPHFCYNDQTEYLDNCFYPFTGGGCVEFLSDCRHIDKLKKETMGKHLGDSNVFGGVEFLYCKEDGLLIPLLTPQFPLGQIQKLHQVPEFQGLEDKHRIEYSFTQKLEQERRPFTTGCSVALLLEPPFNKYVKQLFYLDKGFKSIRKGDSVSTTISVRVSTCKRPQNPFQALFDKTPCTEYERRPLNFTFDDLCFPKYCQIAEDQKPNVRNCEGSHKTFYYTLYYFKTANETERLAGGYCDETRPQTNFCNKFFEAD